jgi:hypothetical protein
VQVVTGFTPSPPPSSPPALPTIEATHEVVLTATVEGAVADFTDGVKDAIATNVAGELAVPKGNVQITVEAASVILTIIIGFADAGSADEGHTTLSALVGSAEDASTFLSTDELDVTVESVELSEPEANEDDGNVAAIAGGAAAGVVGFVSGAVLLWWCLKKKGKASAANMSKV